MNKLLADNAIKLAQFGQQARINLQRNGIRNTVRLPSVQGPQAGCKGPISLPYGLLEQDLDMSYLISSILHGHHATGMILVLRFTFQSLLKPL